MVNREVEGESAASLKLTGTEVFDITGITALNDGETPKTVHVTATKPDDTTVEFDAVVRIDTPGEADYYRNGGILRSSSATTTRTAITTF